MPTAGASRTAAPGVPGRSASTWLQVKSSAGDPDESTRSSVQLGLPWYAVALKPVPMRHGWHRSDIKMLLRCPQQPDVFCGGAVDVVGARAVVVHPEVDRPRAGCPPHRPSSRPTTSTGIPPEPTGRCPGRLPPARSGPVPSPSPTAAARPRTVRSRLVAVKSCCGGESWAQSVGSTMPGRPSWFRALAMAASTAFSHPTELS